MFGKRKLSETEIQKIYETYKDLVFRIAMIRLMNEQDAYDVVQTVFLKIIDSVPVFQDVEHEKRWMIRVTCNTCYSILRRPWRKHKEYIERNLSNRDLDLFQYSDSHSVLSVKMFLRLQNLPVNQSPENTSLRNYV